MSSNGSLSSSDLNRHIEEVLQADRCHNVDRVMRLPSTVTYRRFGRTVVYDRHDLDAVDEKVHAIASIPLNS